MEEAVENLGEVPFEDVIQAVKDIHTDYPQGEWYATENVEKYKSCQWIKARLKLTVLANVKIESHHTHDSGQPGLINPNESMRDAVDKYPTMKAAGTTAANECSLRIEEIRRLIKEGQDIQPVIVRWDKRNNEFWHIDGLHRMVALLLENTSENVLAFVAVTE